MNAIFWDCLLFCLYFTYFAFVRTPGTHRKAVIFINSRKCKLPFLQVSYILKRSWKLLLTSQHLTGLVPVALVSQLTWWGGLAGSH